MLYGQNWAQRLMSNSEKSQAGQDSKQSMSETWHQIHESQRLISGQPIVIEATLHLGNKEDKRGI